MNGIIGMSDLLLNETLTSDQMTYVQAIGQSGRALMSLIDEILDFSRIEAGKLVLANAAFSISDAVENCVGLLQPRAAAKGLDLRYVIEPKAPKQVMGDEPRVRQILLNVLSNAVKFTDLGSVTLLVRATCTETATDQIRIEFSVADTGIGLKSADREGIFGEFEQAEDAVRRRDGGAGLGLAIARQIARAMGGDITVVSVPGQGSTFTAELILSHAAAASETTEMTGRKAMPDNAPRTGSTQLAMARVLLAEDNAVNALLATRLLQREGCEITRVHTGDEAVAAVARTLTGQAPAFDLVLMDIYMPRLDGMEATRAIRRLLEISGEAGAPALPIVAVTANAFAEDRKRYLACGMDDYLAKPFDGRALNSILSRWLRPDRRSESSAA
jgi:CheY-like chemotaxis protein